MKYCIIILLAVTTTLLARCTTPKKATYEFPAAMSEIVRADFQKQCDKGQILYNLNCAKCHNKTIRGRQVIPDFTREQLRGYELRVLNAQHESAMPDSSVNAEELGLISTFLSYKKKNG